MAASATKSSVVQQFASDVRALVGGALRFAGIDQGIDFTGAGPVYALGSGTVTHVKRGGSGWPGEGALLVYRLTSGPHAGQHVYIAEDFRIASGLRVGSKVRAGQTLGQASGSGKAPGIEIGWATPQGQPVAPLNPGPHSPKPAGRDFASMFGLDGATAPASGGLQSSFARDVAKATGLDWRVLFAWAGVEGAYGPHGTGHFNFLNIKGSGGAGTSAGGFAQYGSLSEAEGATARVLRQPNMRGILATAGKPAGEEITAIQKSPWDAGHEPHLRSTFDQLFGAGGEKTHDYQFPWDAPAGPSLPGENIITAPIAWAEGFAKLLGKLADPQFWIRVLEMLGGGVLLLVGLYLLTRQIGLPTPVGRPGRAVAEAA